MLPFLEAGDRILWSYYIIANQWIVCITNCNVIVGLVHS
jgi:hypothetical protein